MDAAGQVSGPHVHPNKETSPAATATGLTTEAARRLLVTIGPNAIADVAQHPLLRAVEKLWAPVPWMLEAAIAIQLGLGDYTEAAVVASLLFANAGLGFLQENRATATLDALRSRLALLASVRRDGIWVSIPAIDLVPGDVVKLSLGAVVASDVHLVSGSVLLDQSMLTGESIPVEAEAGFDACAGALVRRGEAVAQVTATGERTKFGRTAELIRTAKVESSQQRIVLRVVRNLVLFNGAVSVLLAAYALWIAMPVAEIVPLMLVAVLSSIPVALPSMFTLAEAVGARSLARRGILPTSLSAVDEAAGIGVLCCDKTGTLTRNELAVMAVQAMAQYDEAHVLALAALASSDGGADPVDAAIRHAAAARPVADTPVLVAFVPFDPARKSSSATVRQADATDIQVVKGAYEAVVALLPSELPVPPELNALQAKGYRVLALAVGPVGKLSMAGLIALSDPPRDDSAALVAALADLGVKTMMVTGDARATAEVVARTIGIAGPVCAMTPLPDDLRANDFAIFAGVLPEDKFRLVKALQKGGHIVGMCGDGANDAPALRQAQMGIAVSTATDVAKSAAGIVLTEPGLAGVVAAVKEGRITFQRILTYILRSIIHKVVQVLFLTAGLVMTTHAVLTPMLMVLMMITGDFLAMSSATDNVRPSPKPSVWRIRNLTVAGVTLGLIDLVFCVGCLAIGRFWIGLDTKTLQTMTVVILVFSGQAVFYVAREREHLWSSRPGKWLIVCSTVDLALISVLAGAGILMAPLPVDIIAGLFAAAAGFALLLDGVKLFLFRRLAVA
jgi:H+-transporting ATPase